MIKAEDLHKMATTVRDVLRVEMLREVDQRIDAHRRAVWVRDEWCCNEMRAFAMKFWSAPKPRNDEMWGVSYQIHGYHVNYCPFCGAFVGRREK